MAHPKCEDCRFWDTSVTSEDGVASPCRKLPPVADDRDHSARWPMTEETDWCGAFEQDPDRVEEIDDEPLSDAPPDGASEREFCPTHRHLKSGRLKQAIALAYLQTEQPIGDDTPLQLYRDRSGQWWARPTREFDDGRFERLPTPAPTEAPATDADLPDDLASCAWIEACENDPELDEHDLDQRQAFLAGWSSGEEHGIALNPASVNAALADRPAADGAAIRTFAQAILHGDEMHRAWLLEAAEAFVAGKPLPAPRSAARPAAVTDAMKQIAFDTAWGEWLALGGPADFANRNCKNLLWAAVTKGITAALTARGPA